MNNKLTIPELVRKIYSAFDNFPTQERYYPEIKVNIGKNLIYVDIKIFKQTKLVYQRTKTVYSLSEDTVKDVINWLNDWYYSGINRWLNMAQIGQQKK